MPHNYQGPGRNITFCTITTGINIDPHHGCFASAYYEWIKHVIMQRAEIHYEHRTVRNVFDLDVSIFLEAYSPDPRTAYQFLFGLVEHSNGWDELSLANALNDTPFFKQLIQ